MLDLFNKESLKKKNCYVIQHQAMVRDSSYMMSVDLGSCAAAVLAGRDDKGNIWLGANHLFRSRVQNSDMALEQVAALFNGLKEQGAADIRCLGLFGAAYGEQSGAKDIAQGNVRLMLEALNFYNLEIELFQTGYSQSISVLKSDERNSFLIKHHDFDDRSKRIIELHMIQVFH